MDWSNYSNVYAYVKQLPLEVTEDVISSTSFEQCISYPLIQNPIRSAPKKNIFTTPVPTTTSSYTLTNSIWNQVITYLDETYTLCNPSLKYTRTHYFTQAFKNYIMDPILFKFLSGRRAYPVLELLDQPRLEIQKKHVQALGYVLSFLFDAIIYINDHPYSWNSDLNDSSIKINIKGYTH